ncbi:hypothetical protein GGR53DRAFT_475648 [Hypoxylon sp. FL1150]|nr:hypothetical protein GGR53DRAFT_475648 [Hypoxylon sp. FL1150]
MKFQISALFLSIAATAVSAQDTQTGPYLLHITGKEGSTIDGYASSCHAGAAIEGLCYGAGAAPTGNSFEYYFNTTGLNKVGDAPTGTISWNLPYTDQNGNPASEAQVLGLNYLINSNVAAAMFGYSLFGYDTFGFDKDGKLFGTNYFDDSTFTPGTNPAPSGEGIAIYQWYVCWQYFTGYYYQSIGWATTLPPHNPTCEPVDITQVFV